MTHEERIHKLMLERIDALDELRRFKKILVSKVARKRIDNQIKEICEELNRLHDAMYQW